MKIIARGAEAILYKKNNRLVKERIKKSYRIKEIDEELRKLRTRKEVKLLNKAEILVPKVYDFSDKDMKIDMEFIQGKLLRDVLDNLDKKERRTILMDIGKQISKLHEKNIIHGDLTTSNMILKDNKIYFIDFGLGFISNKIEDKAVDLHLLKQAFKSKHYKIFSNSFKDILKGYKNYEHFKEVVKRLEKVEERGRYKRKKKD